MLEFLLLILVIFVCAFLVEVMLVQAFLRWRTRKQKPSQPETSRTDFEMLEDIVMIHTEEVMD